MLLGNFNAAECFVAFPGPVPPCKSRICAPTENELNFKYHGNGSEYLCQCDALVFNFQ